MQGIAVLPEGLEEEGVRELISLGAKSVKAHRRSVSFEGDMSCFYRLHLQARLPFRLLREMARFPCDSPNTLYSAVQNCLDWERWLPTSMSFRVDVSGRSDGLRHSHYSALQVKNAVVDWQRSCFGKRSDIALDKPDICLHLHLNQFGGILSLDGSAGSLHKRGYRAAMGVAPLKENLAAGLMRLSAWDGSVPLVDPLCGSGTLLIEAVSLALGLSPGLHRSYLLEGWADFDPSLWQKEKNQIRRLEVLDRKLPLILGCEKDAQVAKQAKDNVEAAGLDKFIRIQNIPFAKLSLPKQHGFIVCNPPYGKRLGADEDLKLLYEALGIFLKKNASGWQFWLLNGNPELSSSIRMKSSRRFSVNNGGIDCRWLKYLIH
ncbi:THUMP domain-containing class I SAM-dependent RNA methyltransferase [Prochlorococcus sp. MIT 1307]|uniref:THUMP domain-containing class I SAM-dependent RNA methyltransferase n=1 Tax=Prochlorococcus sp. MIT 1307 TaxID=3096219 RepID=UPI002A75C82A|nr:class I SAM-dependent RNA methyltransferase [Prochlorococcus sp. MIT 1307]